MERISVDRFVNEGKRTGTVNGSNVLNRFVDDAISPINAHLLCSQSVFSGALTDH
jgi:hypothetical protein